MKRFVGLFLLMALVLALMVDAWGEGFVTEGGLLEAKQTTIQNEICSVEAMGHIPVIDQAIPATYTFCGLTAGSHCSACGAILQEQKIVPKLVAKKIRMDIKKAALNVDNTLQLRTSVFPEHKTSVFLALEWSSSNKDVVTVSNNGEVRAIGAGKATITVTTPNGKKATCKITVNAKRGSKEK